VIDYATGKPIAGTTVEFTPAAGSVLAAPLRATTDGLGRFHFGGDVTAAGEVTGTFTVRAPTFAQGYTSPPITLRTSSVLGEGVDLGRILARPYFAFTGHVTLRRTGVGASATVRIERMGGVTLSEDPITTTSDEAGYFYVERAASAPAPFIANVSFTEPGQARPNTYSNAVLPVIWRDQVPAVDRVFSVGFSLAYAVQAVHRGLERNVPGVLVTFTRTGGIGTTPAVRSGITNADGLVSVETSPSGDGVVIGDIVLTPAAPDSPRTVRGARMQTFDTDETRLLASYGIGSAARYAGELFNRGADALQPGVAVEFRPTGGVAALGRTDTSNAVGRFRIAPFSDKSGQIIGDLYVNYRPAREPLVIRGLVLQTFEDDSLRYLQQYRIGSAARYAGELFNRATGALQPGVAVEFRPTGGVAALGRTDTSNAVGRFRIAPISDQSGQIVGDLYVNYLPPREPEVIRGLVLQTFEDDSLRYLQRWGVGPSLLYVGELRRDDTNEPIVGAQVTFRRTGGVAATPEVLPFVSIAGGRFSLNLAPATDGEVQGTISVHAPPLRDTTIAITLPTFVSDSVRLRAVYRIRP
jgi:hypothetical protein